MGLIKSTKAPKHQSTKSSFGVFRGFGQANSGLGAEDSAWKQIGLLPGMTGEREEKGGGRCTGPGGRSAALDVGAPGAWKKIRPEMALCTGYLDQAAQK